MHKRIVITISFFLIFFNSRGQNNDTIEYYFYSFPAFHEGFDLTVNKALKSVTLETHNNFYASDSLSPQTFYMMDNERLQKIKKIIPPLNRYSKTVSTEKINQLSKYLKELTQCGSGDYLPGLDGITFFIGNNKNEMECKYWSPNKDGPVGKNILLLIQELRTLFNDNLDIMNRLNITRKYIYIPTLEILSYELPYLKLYRFAGCEDFIKQIEPLKNSDEVFIDITEYLGPNKECITEELYKKFHHIRWIQNEMFDKFNPIKKE